ncbi:MAG TPA: hypothetical protein DCO75_13455 [Fibrobacteres bacterium]|jgi:site-specific recombinase XerD|nr:hypothetical protein [Fibrobacterota bacterium]
MLIRVAQRANIPPPSPHDFRRAFAVTILRNGGDPVSVSRLLGHADIRVTMRYLALVQEDLASTFHKAGPVDNVGIV